MEVALIVNSVAGRGRAGREAWQLARALSDAGVRVEPMVTENAGGGVALARAAAVAFDVVIAVGGDGTVNEVARGLYEARGRARLAVAPFGSGNDFAKVLGMPFRPTEVAKSILGSEHYPLDLGRAHMNGDGGPQEALFVNAVGIGFDGLVAERARSSRKLRGVVGYLLVALRTLVQWDYPEFEVEADGEVVANGPALLATAGNGTCSGGGFYLTPRAHPSDGQLDLCVVARPSTVDLIRLVPALLRGRHLGHRPVTYRQVSRATVRTGRGLFVHTDGEIVSNNAREVSIEVIPGALRVVAPRLG